MDSTVYVASPFVYRAGDEFRPTQPQSTGWVVGPAGAFAGTGRSIAGVLIVAPVAEIQRLLELEIVNGEGRLRWSLGGDSPLYMRLTEDERQLARQFIRQGIARLNDQGGP